MLQLTFDMYSNRLVESLHCSLKSSFYALLNPLSYSEHLLSVLLGLPSSVMKDFDCSDTDLVFHHSAFLPGDVPHHHLSFLFFHCGIFWILVYTLIVYHFIHPTEDPSECFKVISSLLILMFLSYFNGYLFLGFEAWLLCLHICNPSWMNGNMIGMDFLQNTSCDFVSEWTIDGR